MHYGVAREQILHPMSGGECVSALHLRWKPNKSRGQSLFSKKAQLYKSMDLKNRSLTEVDFKNYILEHYTFLSRPVFIIDDKIFIGNGQKNIIEVIKALT